jgi:sugar O-acyltransferase (sialic acid O-acetyltransferase NeuD family)
MSELVLFAVGSSIVVDYEETCARLGIRIAGGIQNVSGEVFFTDLDRLVGVDAMPAALRAHPCIIPLFTPKNRRAAAEQASSLGFAPVAAVIDPTAIVARSSVFGNGTFVNAGAIVGAQARIGEQVVINRGASLGHHVELAAFVSLGPGAILCGHVAIESGTMIGAGAIILPKVRIGADAVVAAGSIVTADVAAGARVFGNPARARAVDG